MLTSLVSIAYLFSIYLLRDFRVPVSLVEYSGRPDKRLVFGKDHLFALMDLPC